MHTNSQWLKVLSNEKTGKKYFPDDRDQVTTMQAKSAALFTESSLDPI